MLELPRRAGPRPATTPGIPHRQVEHTPPAALYARLVERFDAIPDAVHAASQISVPGARALYLPECPGCNSRYGFIRGREFAHLHPADDGSFHMTLAPDDLQRVLAQAWGELHPWSPTGRILPNVAMVYAPRDDREIDIVLEVVAASLHNARAQI